MAPNYRSDKNSEQSKTPDPNHDVVDIIAGNRKFTVLRKNLCSRIPFFVPTFGGGSPWKPGDSRHTVRLVGADSESFQILVEWIYKGHLPQNIFDGIPSNYQSHLPLKWNPLSLCLLATRYSAAEVADRSMDIFVKQFLAIGLNLGPSFYQLAYGNSKDGAKVTQLLAEVFAYQVLILGAISEEEVAQLVKEFPELASDVLAVLHRKRGKPVGRVWEEFPTCRFHSHDPTQCGRCPWAGMDNLWSEED